MALRDTQLLRLRHSDQIKFDYHSLKDKESIYELVLEKVPGLDMKGANRKRIIIEQFEEYEFEPDTLLETEGQKPKYVYIILQGSLVLYKRPESMYNAKGKLISVDDIAFQTNPKDSGN